MQKHDWNIKEVYPNIFQIEDYKGVHVTLIKGEKEAILWDMGYGVYDLKQLIESLIDTPFKVLASHGHLDHTLGCTQFDEIYLAKGDYKLFEENNQQLIKEKVVTKAIQKGDMTEKEADEYLKKTLPKINELIIGTVFDLGGIHAEVIDLQGHTRGSVGLLLKEPEILLTGDAICNDLWIYLPESDSAKVCLETLEKSLKLPFKQYLVAHKDILYPKSHINDIIEVMKNLNSKDCRPRSMYFCDDDVYENHKSTDYGTISILFTEEKLKSSES